jgi:pyridoxamine 5'-phosphate oxidase
MEEFLDFLKNDHSDFDKGSLDDRIKSSDPMRLFQKWYKEAFERNCSEPHAMVVSTVGTDLQPTLRTVYMKDLVEEGLIFYTNYESEKAQQIAANPNVGVLFYWDCLERQVRIRGKAVKAPESISDDYFASRPRGSQIGAWASQQSQEISSRMSLEENYKAFEEKFKGQDIKRPPYWGGFLIEPKYFEFWQGRPSRLHDRICFERADDGKQQWKVKRINP